MRISRFPLHTLKETPADAEVISHQLMLRAGLLRRSAAGIYTWLPLGLRVLRKVEAIVREEMNRAGALEVLMPIVQPAELWQESGRWQHYGPELLRLKDRHQRDFCLGPTHEEIITDLLRREVKSYKQLPVNYYQIQTKFRDEVRPRFGAMRAREFIMKDAYSFHADEASLQETYETMYATYTRIFQRLGLNFRAVQADTGSIGGSVSHEFHVLADSGEDAIAFSDSGNYAANVELATTAAAMTPRSAPTADVRKIATPKQHSIAEVSAFFATTAAHCVKTLLVQGSDGGLVALLLRGDHELNPVKAAKFEQIAQPLTFATAEQVRSTLGCNPGSLGPIGMTVPMFADYAALALSDFVCGANADNYHYTGVNWGRDVQEPPAADLRKVQAGDAAPGGGGTLHIARGIEVGHIFQLGTKYSAALKASILDEQGRPQPIIMGCYGIGVSRIVAAAIEQYHDARGIMWPRSMAPFQVALLPINMHKSARLRTAVETLYNELLEAGIKVLLDDREARPGVMYADAELIGLPERIVMGERSLESGSVEYQRRDETQSRAVALSEITPLLRRQGT